MKIIVHTQIMENYGAHDWDGTGACPQYWKAKGGNTYVVEGVTVDQAMTDQFWDSVTNAIVEYNESWKEYVISMEAIDDIDYRQSDVCEEWESPIILTARGEGLAGFNATRYTPAEFWQDNFKAKLESWVQVNGDRDDYLLRYEFANGEVLPYGEACERVKREAA